MSKDISSPFYLQWQNNGSSNNGKWQISSGPDKNGKYTWSSLSSYNITSGSTYTIYFSGAPNGNSASPYTVFAQVSGGTTTPYPGVKFSSSSGSTQAATLKSLQVNGSLTFSAAQLVSGDPKIKLGQSNSNPTPCWLLWDGSKWYYYYGKSGDGYSDKTPPPSPPSPPSTPYTAGNDLQVATNETLYITNTSSSADDCAIYEGQTSTSSGEYYRGVSSANPQDPASQSPQFTFTFTGYSGDQCTVNLFQWRDSSSTLTTG